MIAIGTVNLHVHPQTALVPHCNSSFYIFHLIRIQVPNHLLSVSIF